MNQATIFITVLLVLTTLIVPKKYFLLPFIVAACFVPTDQRIIIMSLDFTPARILVLVGALRILLRNERRVIKWNIFDKMVLAWALCGAVIYVIQWGDTRALIYKCGVLFDIIGLYWLFRQGIHSWRDVRFIIKVLSVCVLIMTPLILSELLTGRNPFVMLGTVVTNVRAERFRCQASFPISIMLGLFWATLFPLFFSMAMVNKNKILYWGAVVASIFAVIASASSTPLGTLIVVLLIIGAFKWRQYTSIAWKGFFLLLVSLHLVMKAPVWHLLARVNLVGGSTGWHRYYIIEQAINHFSEWVWLGTRDTSGWEYRFDSPRQFDITNQYILEGVFGGVLTLGLFITILVLAFRALSKYYQQPHSRAQLWLSWGIFVAMLGHCVAFLGVSYFGQICLLWYLMLGIIGFVAQENVKEKPVFWTPSLKRPSTLSGIVTSKE